MRVRTILSEIIIKIVTESGSTESKNEILKILEEQNDKAALRRMHELKIHLDDVEESQLRSWYKEALIRRIEHCAEARAYMRSIAQRPVNIETPIGMLTDNERIRITRINKELNRFIERKKALATLKYNKVLSREIVIISTYDQLESSWFQDKCKVIKISNIEEANNWARKTMVIQSVKRIILIIDGTEAYGEYNQLSLFGANLYCFKEAMTKNEADIEIVPCMPLPNHDSDQSQRIRRKFQIIFNQKDSGMPGNQNSKS